MANAHLTPVMQLIVDEGLLEIPSPQGLAKRLSRGLLKDVQDQGLHTLGSWPYEDRQSRAASSTAFRATLGSALDPFSAAGKCTSIPCRMVTAANFARSVALYVDEAIVTDPITSVLMSEHRSLKDFANDLYLSLQVLKTLLPLIQDGVVRFASPARGLCGHCMQERQRLTEEGLGYVERLVRESGLRIEVSARRDGKGARLSFFCPKLLGKGQHEIIGSYQLSKDRAKAFVSYLRKKKRAGLLFAEPSELLNLYIHRFVSSMVGDVMYDFQTAGSSGSTFLSGSRLETAFLASLEQSVPSGREIEKWEAVRTIQLPWVRSLSVDEIVQLRHEAPGALAHLRTSLAERLAGGDDTDASVTNFVKELQSQSVELENELAAYRQGGRRLNLALGGASLAFIMYGIVTKDVPTTATALATALTTLATLHPSSKAETAKLKGRAPYVLVRAKQMLNHREG